MVADIILRLSSLLYRYSRIRKENRPRFGEKLKTPASVKLYYRGMYDPTRAIHPRFLRMVSRSRSRSRLENSPTDRTRLNGTIHGAPRISRDYVAPSRSNFIVASVNHRCTARRLILERRRRRQRGNDSRQFRGDRVPNSEFPSDLT